MSHGTAAQIEPPTSNDILSDNRFWGQWVIWVDAAAKAFRTYIAGLVHHGSSPQSSSSAGPTLEVTANSQLETKTTEKVYRINDHGRVLKRSLKPDEYYICENGEPFIPDLIVEGLQNEAACMEFVRRHTDIPVPKLLKTYEEDGAYCLWMEYIDGVEMSDLKDEEKSQILPQGNAMFAGSVSSSEADIGQLGALLLLYKAFDRMSRGGRQEFFLLRV